MNYGVRNYQKINKLKVDGIVGAKTMLSFGEKHDLSKEQLANFFGQIAHESNEFKAYRENLNYSATGLIQTFKKYRLNPHMALAHARNPEKIANYVYANRMGNGDANSGDGFKYRGNGAIQLTGYNNHKAFSDYVNDFRIMHDTDIVWQDYYFDSAKWFFDINNIWRLCDSVSYNNIKKVTSVINGGLNGINDRAKKTIQYYERLNKH